MQLLANPDKRAFIKKNELKTYQNLRIIDDRRFARDKELEEERKRREEKRKKIVRQSTSTMTF